MWPRFFHMYKAIKFKEFYYAAHAKRVETLCLLYSMAVSAVSIGSVVVWSISKTAPTCWAIIIAAAQFAQVLMTQLPWYKQKTALAYLLPELKKLSLKIDRDYMKALNSGLDDDQMLELISKYERAFADLENQFVQDIIFHEIKTITKTAEADMRAYFNSKYPEDSAALKGSAKRLCGRRR